MKLTSAVQSLALLAHCLRPVAAAALVAEFKATQPRPENILPEDPAELLLARDDDTAADIVDLVDSKADAAKNSAKDYIVILRDGEASTLARRSQHHDWVSGMLNKRGGSSSGIKGFFNENGGVDSTYINGYHGTFTAEEIEQIKASEDVALVERESYDTIQQEFVYVQYNTPWGLGRISHKTFDSPQGTDDATYLFASQGGTNTTLYILDSGVRADHVEFTGRVRWGANYVDDQETDVHGHGTHITGIAAGHNVGVAKFANIVAVKVIDSQRRAAISNIIKGVQWIIDDHNSHPGQKSVINYSAVGVISDARTQAIQKATEAGIMVVTAAGNSEADACQYGPANMAASTDGVLTIAALNYTNTPASFTNYGSCVSAFAPGVSILSAANDTVNAYKYMSGTSMSSPYVAGLVSYFWSIDPTLSLAAVKTMAIDYNNGAIGNVAGNTSNRLAYNHL